MLNRSDRLVEILDEFVGSTRDVEAAAVISLDGLPMASALPEHMEEDRLGAMAAALLSLGEQAAAGLGRGALSQVFVEGAGGFVFLMSARERAVLAAITGHEAKIGFMLYQMRQAADDLGALLEPARADRTAEPTAATDTDVTAWLDHGARTGGHNGHNGSAGTVPGPPADEAPPTGFADAGSFESPFES